jgi:hypothetical protein
MILYVNGCSHAAGAEAVNDYCFAEDDPLYWALGRQPHPDNLKVSWGCELANMLGAILRCDAESASSTDRIIRTTRQYLNDNKPDLIVIGWPTWEREEWLIDGVYYQVNASGHDSVPADYQNKYKEWISNLDFKSYVNQTHNKIFEFHLELENQNIKHLFFSTAGKAFDVNYCTPQVWSDNYLEPYNNEHTYFNWLKNNGYKTVRNSYHFGPDAHTAWAEFLYQNYVQKLLTT